MAVPRTADIVVIGSGAFGSATAYHLARRGADVVVLDQHALASQTTPRAAGPTCEALARFEQDMGRSVGFHRSGSLKAAYTDAGEARLHQGLDTARALGIAAELISAGDAERLAPHFSAGAARAIGHVPSDGWLDPSKVASGFAARAAELGARMLPFTPARELLRSGGRVSGVMTAEGPIATPVVVDAAGAWTARVAAAAGIALPLVPVRHQLFVTEPIAGVAPMQPVVRLLEASVYVRYEAAGLMFGGYEDRPRVIDAGALPAGFDLAPLELDLGVLRALVGEVVEHFPVLRTARVALDRVG